MALNLLCASDYYFSAIEHCFEKIYSEDAMNVVTLLEDTERAYADYITGSKSSAGRAAFNEAFNALKQAYTALADKSEFNADFEATYTFYQIKNGFFA